MYFDSLACVRVKGGDSEWFMIDSGMRQGCIMSPWLFKVYMKAVMKEVKKEMGRRRVRFLEEGREWRLPGLLHADDLVLCGESEEGLRAIVGRFGEVCRRKGLKVNAGKRKVVVLNGEEGLVYEVCVDGERLEHVSEFKYFGRVLDESGTDEAECRRKVASGRRVADTIRSLVKARGLQLKCERVLHETLFVLVLMYSSETMLWKEEISRISVVRMVNLRGLLGIMRMNGVPNGRIRQLCGVTKGLIKVFYDGSAVWREWRRIGLLRESM